MNVEELAKKLILDLVSEYTPPGHEYKLAPIIRGWADELGYDEFYTDEVGNIFLRYGSHGRTILLASHLDTVPGKVDVKVVQDTVYGRGVIDAKGPLTAFIVGAALDRSRMSNCKVYVGGLVREEDDGLGAKYLVEKDFRSDHIIIGEPTNLGIAIAYRGSILIKVSANAIGGHSSAPYIGSSALDKLIEFINIVKSRFNGESFDEVSCAFTMLKAGDWPSSLPREGEAYANIRYPPKYSSDNIIEEIKDIAQKVGVGLEFLSVEKPVEVSVNTEVVRALVRGVLRLNLKPRIVKKTGTSDMNTLAVISKSIAAFGPGDSRLAHTDYEKIKIGDIVTASNVVSNALMELSRL